MVTRFLRHVAVGWVLLIAASAAWADTFHLGNIGHGNSSLGIHNVTGSFLDTYDFTVMTAGDVGVGAGVLNFNLLDQPYFNIHDFSVALYSRSSSRHGGRSGGNLDFTVPGLASGNYYLTVSGVANGTNGGAYSGALSLTPVPEADAWVLLIAGLGMVGWMTSRRAPV